jgi:hypothetical protein
MTVSITTRYALLEDRDKQPRRTISRMWRYSRSPKKETNTHEDDHLLFGSCPWLEISSLPYSTLLEGKGKGKADSRGGKAGLYRRGKGTEDWE